MWLTKQNMDKFSVPQNKFVGNSRNNKHGGGVEVCVNQSYQFTERAALSRNLDSVMEAQFIELNSTWSYENRVSKHFVIFRNFPCLIA